MLQSRPLMKTFLAGASLLALHTAALANVAATALPTGGTVTAGAASINQQGAAMTVNQTSQRAIIDWQSFNVGGGAAVNFVQPNSASVALNRVLSAAPSVIDGKINANGQVYLINPAGIVFGAGAVVNVGGLVASTMNIDDADFMAGQNVFNRNGSTGAIVNKGSLTATPGGMIALLAPELRNEGVISAQLGTVVLAAGEKIVLTMDTAGGVTVQVDPAQIRTMIDNRSIVVAKDGTVILSAKAADALLGSTINNSGTIEASSMTSHGGTIELTGATDIVSTGTLNASGVTGGTVAVAADQTSGLADIAGKVSVAGTNGKGGATTVTGNHVLVDNGANIDATGTQGGGTINVGGSWQNQDPTISESVGVNVAPGAVLDASATVKGDGGTIAVRSDVTNPNAVTYAEGTFLALGGPQGGNGGRIETSGYFLDIAGARGGASAAFGASGLWLLDPYDVTIVAGTTNSNGGFSSGTWTPSATGSQVGAGNITTLLNGGTNVAITTIGAGGDSGNITVSSEIDKTSGGNATLTLSAVNNVVVNAAINNTSSTGALNVNLYADNDANGSGIIYLNGDITTAGGAVNFGANTTASINGVNTLVGGDVYVTGAGLRSISTGGGAVNVYGQMLLADTSGLSIATAGGNVKFAGLIDSGDTYALVNSPFISWTAAVAAAQSGTGGNVGDTYLATVTSRLESQVVATTTLVSGAYQAVWLGAERVTGIGTDAVWRWVTGPEGLEGGGHGLAFFTQNGSDTVSGSGGAAINGAYTNWNSGEPNNSGGTNLSGPGSGEYVMQTLGASGLWNDLAPTNNGINYYVVETNLANSPLSVNAGSGTVTFAGAVGSNKQLASLTVTGSNIAINGGSVASSGAQTYTGPVALGASATTLTVSAGNFTGVSSESIMNASGGNATLTINASGDVEIASNQSVSSSTGSLGVSLISQGGSDKLDAGSSINTNGGALLLQANGLSVNASATTQGGSNGSLQIEPYTQGTSLGIGDGAAGSLNIAGSSFTSNFINNTFGAVTLGGTTTGTVSVANTLSFANNTTIESDANTVLTATAALTATGKTIGFKLDNGGTVSENNASAITAGGLLLTGAGGTFMLNNGTNTAANFAANTGSMNYVNNGALTVGTLSGTSGVTATGNVVLQATGAAADITLTKPVTSTGGNITLAAARNFINNTTSNTGIVASGGGKQYFVYSTDPAASTEGMTSYSKHYSQTYTAASVPAYASSGNWFFYSIAPVITVAPASNTITYGAADPSMTANYSGFIDGDTSGTIGLSGSSTFSLASYTASGAGFRPVGAYSETLTSLGTLANNLGYSFAAGMGGTLTVNRRDITVTGVTAADKFFDGNVSATITGISGASGLLTGDRYVVSGVGAFDTSAIGSGKTVTETSILLGGADGGNYRVTTTGLTTTASIKAGATFIPPVDTSNILLPPNPTGSQTQPVPQQQQAQIPPLVTGTNFNLHTPQNAGLNLGQGVVLTEIHDSGWDQKGILATVGEVDQGFSFTIPRGKFGLHGKADMSLSTGEHLPSWLSYNPKTGTFSAPSVPPGGLPVIVALNVSAGKKVELTISQ